MKKIGTKSKTKLYIIIEAVLIAIIIGMSIFFGLALNGRRVDFDQNITSEDGAELNHTFDAKADEDFAVRFADLECNEDCSNVLSVRIGNKNLENGKDYEVKHGSVIIRIFKKVLQAIANGEHDIVVKINQDGETITVGVKITITNSTATDKQPEQHTEPENNDNSSQNSPAPRPAPAPEPSPSPTPESIPEPSPSPTPESIPEPTPTPMAEFNMNDGYIVAFFGVTIYKVDENKNPVYNDDGTLADQFTYNKCDVKKDSVTVKTVYNTTLSKNISVEQWNAEIKAAEGRGLEGYGGGYTLPLDESMCNACSLSCGRW